jgi:hypothetical protein
VAIIFPQSEILRVSFTNRELRDIIAYVETLRVKD